MQPDEKDLRQRTKEFGLQILSMFSGLPKTTEAQVLGKQVLRSGTSVGANYREAYRAGSRAEFIAKCGDSLRELEETAYWLELLSMERSFLQISSHLSGRNAINSSPFLLRF